MTILALTLLTAAALLGGLAVDVMRFENERTRIQTALDLCVLNAANMRQTLIEQTVFDDCVATADVKGAITKLTVTKSTTTKTVSATATKTLPTLFLGMLGMDTLNINAQSAAMQGVSKLEIALVLDVSGSMSGTRITALRTAAKQFVNTVMKDDTLGQVAITVVPYSSQVNLGTDLIRKFNAANIPANAPTLSPVQTSQMVDQTRCILLPDSIYTDGSSAILRTTPYNALGLADFISASFSATMRMDRFMAYGDTNEAVANTANSDCQNIRGNQVRLPGFSDVGSPRVGATPAERIAALNAIIDGLSPAGNTSINTGMRWGLAFLDPAARSIFAEYAAAGQMPAAYASLPADFNNPDVMKIIVLMTDGENFGDVRLNDNYRTGNSPIFRGTDGNYSIRFMTGRPATAGTNEYWVPHRNSNAGEWRATPWGGTTTTLGTQLSWQQVWQQMTPSWAAWHLYARALGTSSTRNSIYTNQYNDFRTQRGTSTSTPEMDAELQQICTLTKQQGVLIYGIAFSAPTRGITTVRNCASSDGHFFNSTDNTALNAAFQSIATNITQLRLVN